MSKVYGVGKLRVNVEKIFDDAIGLDEIGEFLIKRIQTFTRAGKSLDTGRKIKKLSEAYIKQRHRAVLNGGTFGQYIKYDEEFFDPDFSNLTFTGQMLASLIAIPNKRERRVTIVPHGDRDDGLTNKKVAEYVDKGGRRFLVVDQKAQDRIKRDIIKRLRLALRKSRL